MKPKLIKKYLFLGLGVAATGIGMVGAFLPLLPSAPFALLALYCFSVSSPRFQSWLLGNHLLEPTLRSIKEKHGLTVAEKARILTVMWASMLTAAFLVMDAHLHAQTALMLIAALKTVFILRYKTRSEMTGAVQ